MCQLSTSLKTEMMWSVESFKDMRARHEAFKKRYPDRPETHGAPYQGIENLRPETKELLEAHDAKQKFLKQ